MSPDVSAAFQQGSHKRFNPLTKEWVLVSPHRTMRPWQGQRESVGNETLPPHDAQCYLCAGNMRAGGLKNPHYTDTFVFDNDFAALKNDGPAQSLNDGLFVAETETGLCRVICFSPRHDLTLARMAVPDIAKVVATLSAETRELSARDDITSVQIFENRGAVMGCSNPHPHGQIWASSSLPNEMIKETTSQNAYFAEHGRPMLLDYLHHEQKLNTRIVYENESFAILVPFWAIWPFETLLLPKRAKQSLLDLSKDEQMALADVLSNLTIRYDNLFETSFPYSMGFHQKPFDGKVHEGFQLHAHFYPPLLRSASVKKFMVGFEMLGSPQRDITPEAAAERLRSLPDKHYLGVDTTLSRSFAPK